MKKFIVIYHSSPEVVAQRVNMKSEDQAESMKFWMAWKESMGDKLEDFGTPLMNGIRLFKDGSSVPSGKEVTGYSIIRANDMVEAKALLGHHPCFNSKDGCDVEIHECVLMY